MNSKSKWTLTNQRCERHRDKNILSKWVETRKDPNSPAIRCRLCATEVNTGEPRSHTFAATLCEIRAIDSELGSELQAQASNCVDDHCV